MCNNKFDQELYATSQEYRASLSTDFDFARFVSDEAYRSSFQLQGVGNNVYNVVGTIYFVRLNKDGGYTWI